MRLRFFAAVLLAAAIAAVATCQDFKFFMAGHFTAVHPFPAAAVLGFMSNETLSGVEAAFLEQNRKGGIAGKNLTVSLFEDNANIATAVPQLMAAMADPTLDGVVTATAGEAFVVNQVARAMKMPVFGPTTINTTELLQSTPDSDYLLHTRQTISSEGAAMLNFAVNSDLHCRSFFLVFLDAYGIAGPTREMRDEIIRLGLGEPMMLGFPPVADPNFAATFATFAQMYAAAPEKPSCFMFLADSSTTAPIIPIVASLAGAKFADTHFITPSAATLPQWVDTTTGQSTLFGNVYISQPAPSGFDTRFEFIRSYQAAMGQLKLSGSGSHSATFLPNPFAVDGYMAGRFTIEVLSRIGHGEPFTRRGMKDVVYRTKTFQIDDVVMGPYSNGCQGRQTAATGACWCTIGMKSIFFTRVNPANGIPQPVLDNAYYPGVAEVPVPLAQCDLVTSFLQRPYIALVLHDALVAGAATADAAALRSAVVEGLRAAVSTARGSGKLTYGPAFATPVAQSNITRATISQLEHRYRAVWLLGSTFDPAAVYPQLAAPGSAAASQPSVDLIDIAPTAAAFPDRDADWAPAAHHVHNRIPFYPTLADLAVTAAAYCTQRRIPATSITAVVDNAALVDIATKAVETHSRAAPARVTVAPTAITASFFASAAPAGGSAGPQLTAAVVVVTRRSDVVAAAVAYAATAPGVAVLLAANEFVLGSTLSTVASIGPNVFLVSGLPSYMPASDAVRTLSPVRSYGAATAAAVMATYQLTGDGNGTAAELSAVAFRALGVPVPTAGIALNPLWSKSCGLSAPVWPHPGGQCQCSKGLNTFFVRAASDFVANASTPNVFQWRHVGCGPSFTALEESTKSTVSSALVAVIATAATVFLVAIVAAVLWFACLPGSTRDNKNAPTEAREAFTMVFTDIQGSTKLWAQAPDLMGEALDAHHRILRQCVRKHRGYEVKTIGDSFMVAFKDPKDALTFCFATQESLYSHDFGTDAIDEVYRNAVRDTLLAAQQAAQQSDKAQARASLAESESEGDGNVLTAASFAAMSPDDYAALWNGLRVRVGMHYGTGSIRFEEAVNGYDYYGTVVNTAARVEGVGHGGQVLLTGDAFEKVESMIPGHRAAVTDLGPQPLRGLPAPVRLVQVLPEAFAGRRFPALRLDVEYEVDEDDNDETGTEHGRSMHDGASVTNDDSASKMSSAISLSVDDLASLVTRRLRLKNPGAVRVCAGLYEALRSLVAAMKASERKDVMQSFATAWRVKSVWSQTQLKRLERNDAKIDDIMLMATVGRVVQSLEVASTTGAQATHSANFPALHGLAKTPGLTPHTSNLGPGGLSGHAHSHVLHFTPEPSVYSPSRDQSPGQSPLPSFHRPRDGDHPRRRVSHESLNAASDTSRPLDSVKHSGDDLTAMAVIPDIYVSSGADAPPPLPPALQPPSST